VNIVHDEMLEFYRNQSKISTPGKYQSYFDELPESMVELCQIVQNSISHVFWIKNKENYGFTDKELIEQGRDLNKELNQRTVEEKLAYLFSLEDTPLTGIREGIHKVAGNCRDFALFLVSILRHKGIPARVRSGAARYFWPPEMDKFEDHYICEYWNENEKQWQMVDPQIDELQRKALNVSLDFTLDLPYDKFLGAGRTWLKFREGKTPQENFGIGEWRGQIFVLNKLIMELASLNKVEVLAWEAWGHCSQIKNLEEYGDEMFDELAKKISEVNEPEIFFELKNLFENDSRYKIPENYKPWFMKFDF